MDVVGIGDGRKPAPVVSTLVGPNKFDGASFGPRSVSGPPPQIFPASGAESPPGHWDLFYRESEGKQKIMKFNPEI